MAMNIRRNPLAALLDYAANRGDEASSIGSVMSQLASPILKSQGVQPEAAVQRGPVPQPTLANVDTTTIKDPLFGRMVQQESGGRSGLVSPKGAAGLAQVLPSTAMDPGYGVPTIFEMADAAGVPYADKSEASAKNLLLTNDALNLQFGQAYKDAMAGRYGGDPAKTAAAYNAGPGAVDAYNGVPPYPETQGYVANVVPGYNTSISTMSAPQTGGGMPQTVEGILSTLYPDGSADEKTARRKDILMGLSQGLSALSQGRPVDLSNIAANADQRRRQYVLDTREKEKAKAAASLVYSQTGDANMAAGIASGAINYSDVLNERQMKRAEQAAQDARLKDAATTDALTSAMKAANMPQETIDLVKKGGVDALNAYQKIQADQSLLEQEAQTKDKQAQNVADAQYILSTAAQGSPQARAAERVIALGGAEDYYTLIKDRAPPAGAATPDQIEYADVLVAGGKYPDRATALQALLAKGGDGGGTANMEDAQALVAAGTINQATGKPYTLAEALGSTILTPPAPPNMQYALGPNGQVVLVPAVAGGTPEAAVGAPTPTVGNAFSSTYGSVSDAAKATLLPGDVAQQAATLADTIAGTAATTQETALQAEAAPTALELKKTELAASKQKLEQAVAQAPSESAKLSAEAALAALKVQEAQLNIDSITASAPTDAEKAKVDLAKARADLAAAMLENQKKSRELADVETGKAASLAASLARADTGASVTTSTVSDILKATADWEAGMLGGIQRAGAALIPGSDTYNVESVLIPQLDANSIISNITAMKAASPSGATGFGATTAPELDALRDLLGKLDIRGDPSLLRQNVRVLNNYVLDSAYGTVEQIRANDKLTDAEKEFYGQRYDVKSGEIKYLGVTPIDEGVITMWDNPAPELDPSTLTPEEQALFDSINAPAGGN
jgi:hypothetical protein